MGCIQMMLKFTSTIVILHVLIVGPGYQLLNISLLRFIFVCEFNYSNMFQFCINQRLFRPD